MCIVIAVLPTVLVYFSNMSEGVTENRSEKECSGVKYYDNNQKPPTCGMLYMCVCAVSIVCSSQTNFLNIILYEVLRLVVVVLRA